MKKFSNILVLVIVVVLAIATTGVISAYASAFNVEDSAEQPAGVLHKEIHPEPAPVSQAEPEPENPIFSALLIGEELAENIGYLSEEQLLAKFLDHEGGDLFERTLIAEIVCDLKKEWEVDSIHEVFTSRRYFAINKNFWNSIETPSESSQAIAHMVLECANGQEQYLSNYNAYYFNDSSIESLWDVLIGDREFFSTSNYIFVTR